jgi:hypothetical protein
MRKAAAARPKTAKASAVQASGHCACGAIKLEIDVPARWAWHDHSAASRRAHGAAYATYVGSYRSRFRILEGAERLVRYEDAEHGGARSFCGRCGAPVLYERDHSPTMVNIPRALFDARTGREPRYHMNITEQADWTYLGEPLGPLKGYPGVLWERPRKKKPRAGFDPMF